MSAIGVEGDCWLYAVSIGGWTLQVSGDLLLIALALLAIVESLGMRYIPNSQLGIVERLWSSKGSVASGQIIALAGEAGFCSDILRGGFHFGLWRWQYRIHRVSLVLVPQGEIGYIYARDGEPLAPSQTLGRVVPSNNFQDARAFLQRAAGDESPVGQRGRQRAILREGVYAINLALFIVITKDRVYQLPLKGQQDRKTVASWQQELSAHDGFTPTIVGGPVKAPDSLHPGEERMVDSIGIVTVHDGPVLDTGEVIAPAVGNDPGDPLHHNNYQDPEKFLAAGGRRGRQYMPLIDGTYFINRWFATVDLVPKTVVPIGYVGVVVSYCGHAGNDVSGQSFRHGERVAAGDRGVWARPLGPGKYPFNPFGGNIILVPTTNFVLHWITGKTESHRYDESLRSIDLVTKDAYEPLLPLSVVVHIDYEKAPNVIQRFGDVKKLITQTLDPMLSAYFRDVAHKCTMLGLLHERDAIQHDARNALCVKFREFDIECVDVLIGKPDTAEADGKIETLLEQLRQRQLASEQIETYDRQRLAADKLRTLHEAQALAHKQTELTNSRVQVSISENEGDANLARARKQAEQTVVLAQANSRQRELEGRGEGAGRLQVGLSEAAVLLQKVRSFGDPRLFAMSLVTQQLAQSQQPLVPERVFVSGGDGNGSADSTRGILGLFMNLLVAEKSGFQSTADQGPLDELDQLSQRFTKEAVATLVDRTDASAVNDNVQHEPETAVIAATLEGGVDNMR